MIFTGELPCLRPHDSVVFFVTVIFSFVLIKAGNIFMKIFSYK